MKVPIWYARDGKASMWGASTWRYSSRPRWSKTGHCWTGLRARRQTRHYGLKPGECVQLQTCPKQPTPKAKT